MIPSRRVLSAVGVIAVAMIAGLALRQIGQRRVEANQPLACTSARTSVDQPGSSVTSGQQAVTLRLDYTGAESLITALGRDSLSDADVDSLLRIPGLCAMVDNVTRFVPGNGVREFKTEIRAFARDRKGGKYDGYFRFTDVWEARRRISAMIAEIRANEPKIVEETFSQLERYRPNTGPLTINSYFVAGGVSDGFVFENDPRSFYINMVSADSNVNGVVLNMAHEAYHVMQVRAQERSGINPRWLSMSTMPPVERLFAGTLAEGTANYAADPSRSTARSPSVDSLRERYLRNAEPKRVARNFARFDDLLAKLRGGRITWDQAYTEGFTGKNDESLYFVGYEMTKALEQYCGSECIGPLFEKPPIEFFRTYVALYRQHPEVPGRFSPQTEAVIGATDVGST